MRARLGRTRREFLREAGLTAAGTAAMAAGFPALAAEQRPDVVVVSGDDTKAMVKKAIEGLGGMKRYVSKGDVVVVKPNMSFERKPELAATTNPDVVVGLIEMALDAGASQVKVFDRTVMEPEPSYRKSGIAEAAKKASAKVLWTKDLKTTTLKIPKGEFLKESQIYSDALECDCYITVPVAKPHGIVGASLCIKNQMGITADDRRTGWHKNINQAIADFSTAFKSKLNVLDCWRILTVGYPRGFTVRQTKLVKQCAVSEDQFAIDAYGATVVGTEAKRVPHLALGAKVTGAEIDVSKLTIRRQEV